MKISFELTFSEFKSALRLHSRQKIARRIHFWIYDYLFLLVTAGLGIVAGCAFLSQQGELATGCAEIGLVLAVLTASLFILRNHLVRTQFKALFPRGCTNRVSTFVLDESCLFSSVEGVGEGRYLWSAMTACVQDQNVILFYLTDLRFLVLPQRALSSDQRLQLDSLILNYKLKRKPC